jgi:hypothetical protein
VFLLITRKSTNFVLVAFICIALVLPVDSLSNNTRTRHLFKIERSKNENIVQYDVQIEADGKLDSREPVIAYWVRLAKDGRKEDLNWVEKKFAYGFKAEYNAETNTATLDMVAKINRKINVREVRGEYRAETVIAGQSACLEKIYITSKGKGLATEVISIELFGVDEGNGEDRYEKIIP